jgi:ribose/xylose/arabinose/galactoside ABC-type transport system permease subunit
VVFFQIKSSLFLSAGNLVNLMTQAPFIITLGMAEVFVLLLGEIDLAAGFTAACGAVIALGRAGGAWGPGRLHRPARPDPVRPLHLRDRR